MKIGIISTYNVECGISTYSEHLTDHFPVGKTTIFGNQLLTLSDTKSNLTHPIIRCWNRFGNFKDLTEKIIKNKMDVVHFQHEFGLFQDNDSFCEMLKTLHEKGIKIVITFHTIFSDKFHAQNNTLRRLFRYIDLVIVHQDGAKEMLDIENVVVIPHGSVEVKAKSRKESRKYLNISEDKFVCMFLGFISPNKGQVEASVAAMNLKRRHPNIQLIIAGLPVIHGSHFENLEYCLNLFRGVKRMGGFDTIKIIPKFIDEADFDYYAGAADIFIENHGNTHYSTSGISHLIMSYGLPSVSSRAFILDDLNDSRSIKFNVGDIKGMERAIEQLIMDENLRKTIAKNARKFAEETMWDKTAEKHLKHYERLI